MKSEAPQTVQVWNRDLECQICRGDRFWKREGHLNASVASFFNLDWTNPSATCLICASCGYIHWFFPVDDKQYQPA